MTQEVRAASGLPAAHPSRGASICLLIPVTGLTVRPKVPWLEGMQGP